MINNKHTLHQILMHDEAQVGYVSIPSKMTTIRMMKVFLEEFVPLASEIHSDRIVYLGLSDHFIPVSTPADKIPTPPEYYLQLRDKGGEVEFDKFLTRQEIDDQQVQRAAMRQTNSQ